MNYDSLTQVESGEKAEKLLRKSASSLPEEKGKAGTKRVVKTPAECEVRLSILQAAFEQFLEAGGRAKIEAGTTLYFPNVRICNKCQLWTLEKTCPVCDISNPGWSKQWR